MWNLKTICTVIYAVSVALAEYNFEYGMQYGDLVIGSYDDHCRFVSITPILIFGTRYQDIYVCTNGVVSFNGSYTDFTPTFVTAMEGLSLLAPYHADIDFSYGSSAVYYHIYDAGQNGTNMSVHNVKTAEALITVLTGRSLFTIQTMLIVTWDKGQHYGDANGCLLNRTVSLQLVLVSDGVHTYAVYKYFPAKMRFNWAYDVFIGYMFQSLEYNQHPLSFTRNALQIDQYVETKGIQGILFYPLRHETLDTISDQTFAFGAVNGDKLLRDVDDACSVVPNSYIFPLFNTLHRDVFVCSNGIVTIDREYISSNIPNDFMSMSPQFDVLMPYYTDIELQNDGVVYYQVNDATKDDDFRQRQNVIKAEAYVRDMKTNTRYFEAQFLLLVTWYKVRPRPAGTRPNETMSFQLVLVSDGLDTYVLYIYFEHEMNLRNNKVIIGYMTRSGHSTHHLFSATTSAWNISNILRKNGGKGVIFYELTDRPNQDNLPAHKCIKWYSRNNPGKTLYNESMSQMPDCPCTMDFLRRDPRFTSLTLRQGDAQCSYMRPSWWFRPLGVGKTCCYHDSVDHHFVQSGPYAGGYIRYNPWFSQNWHVRDDLEMRENCCDKKDLCNLYHALRPTGNCYTTFPLQFGPNCEEDPDGCASFPCSVSNCTDYPPSLHKQLELGYNCSDCPIGYRMNAERQCIDIDECLVESDGCAQICQNTEGSFSCFCNSTFRLNGDGKTCKDINECQEAMSDCDQICTNINGAILADVSPVISIKCVAPDACANMNCGSSAGCTVGENGNATCFCNVGYLLSPDGLSCEACDPLTYGENCSQVCECGRGVDRCDPVRGCICRKGWTGPTCEDDVDECGDRNICGDIYKTCVNTNGSYECRCVDGSIVNENNTCLDNFTMIIGISIGSGLLILIAFVVMIIYLKKRNKNRVLPFKGLKKYFECISSDSYHLAFYLNITPDSYRLVFDVNITPDSYRLGFDLNITLESYHLVFDLNIMPDSYHLALDLNIMPDSYYLALDLNITPDSYHLAFDLNIMPDSYHLVFDLNIMPDAYRLAFDLNIMPNSYHLVVDLNIMPDSYHLVFDLNITPSTSLFLISSKSAC